MLAFRKRVILVCGAVGLLLVTLTLIRLFGPTQEASEKTSGFRFTGSHENYEINAHSLSGERSTNLASAQKADENIRANRKKALKHAVTGLLQYYRKVDIDALLGLSPEARRDPNKWGFGFGIYLESAAPELQGRVDKLRDELWEDSESFLSLLEIMREMTTSDVDAIRIVTLYAGGRGVGNSPFKLPGADITFGRILMFEVCKETDPWMRMFLLRGISYSAEEAYSELELSRLMVAARSEDVSANVAMLLEFLGSHLSRFSSLRDFCISEALQFGTESASRMRQLTAARLLCSASSLRDDPDIFAMATQLLNRLDDPELQLASLNYLNPVGNTPRDRPDLSVENARAVQYFERLVAAYSALQRQDSRSPVQEGVRQQIISKALHFDMPDAARFLESILRDPNEPQRTKLSVLSLLAASSFYDKQHSFQKSENSWLTLLTNVSQDPRVGVEVRIDCFHKLMVFQNRRAQSDRDGVVREIVTIIERMRGDSDSRIREAGEVQLKRARDLGLFK